MKKIFSFIILILTIIQVYCQKRATTEDGLKVLLYNDSTWVYAESDTLFNLKASSISRLEIPKLKAKEKLISHVAYSLSYNENHEQANWVAYELTSEETNGTFERTNKFIVDPLVKTETANDNDYSGSGYDRGHLAPAGDMRWSSTAMSESFFYSNVSPQEPGFNRGIWKRCEDLVRSWALENKVLYIATGPLLTQGLTTIGRNKVSVPKYYYKVILDYTDPGIKGIGFILPNQSSKEPLQNYAVSIDSVETITGIDFFPQLPDDQESIIESKINLKAWSWKSSNTASKDKKETTSTQCKGITKNNTRCKNMTLNSSGYCYLHENQSNNSSETSTTSSVTRSNSTSVQCSGTTKKGTRCRNKPTNLNGRCYLHQLLEKKD